MIPPVFIHPEAIIERSVIGPYVSIGKQAKVHNCILRDSILDEGVEVNSVLLEESMLGRWVRLTGRFRHLNIGDSSIEL